MVDVDAKDFIKEINYLRGFLSEADKKNRDVLVYLYTKDDQIVLRMVDKSIPFTIDAYVPNSEVSEPFASVCALSLFELKTVVETFKKSPSSLTLTLDEGVVIVGDDIIEKTINGKLVDNLPNIKIGEYTTTTLTELPAAVFWEHLQKAFIPLKSTDIEEPEWSTSALYIFGQDVLCFMSGGFDHIYLAKSSDLQSPVQLRLSKRQISAISKFLKKGTLRIQEMTFSGMEESPKVTYLLLEEDQHTLSIAVSSDAVNRQKLFKTFWEACVEDKEVLIQFPNMDYYKTATKDDLVNLEKGLLKWSTEGYRANHVKSWLNKCPKNEELTGFLLDGNLCLTNKNNSTNFFILSYREMSHA